MYIGFVIGMGPIKLLFWSQLPSSVSNAPFSSIVQFFLLRLYSKYRDLFHRFMSGPVLLHSYSARILRTWNRGSPPRALTCGGVSQPDTTRNSTTHFDYTLSCHLTIPLAFDVYRYMDKKLNRGRASSIMHSKRHRCSPQLSFPFMTDSDATHQLQIRQRRKSLYLTTIHDWYIITIFHRLQTYTRISRLCWSTVALAYPRSRPPEVRGAWISLYGRRSVRMPCACVTLFNSLTRRNYLWLSTMQALQ
jgi:hypothetical protein